MSDSTTEGGAGPIIIRRSVDLLRMHGTKIIGYVAAVAGAVSVMDPKLVAETLGPHATQWALLITGVSAIVRGHTNRTQVNPENQPKS